MTGDGREEFSLLISMMILLMILSGRSGGLEIVQNGSQRSCKESTENDEQHKEEQGRGPNKPSRDENGTKSGSTNIELETTQIASEIEMVITAVVVRMTWLLL